MLQAWKKQTEETTVLEARGDKKMLLTAAMTGLIIISNYMFWRAGKAAAECEEQDRINRVTNSIDVYDCKAGGMIKAMGMLMDMREKDLMKGKRK